MALEYVNRARNLTSSAITYWTTVDSADPGMTDPSAPPSDAWGEVVTVSTRAIRAGLYREDLSSQVSGSTTEFTTSRGYVLGTLRVWWNGQRQTTTEFTEINATTFTATGFTVEAGDAMEVAYRPR